MKQPTFIILFVIFLVSACQQNTAELETAQKALAETQVALQQAKQQIAELQSAANEEEGGLVHFVFFKVKKDLSATEREDLMKILETLGTIEQVQDLEIGEFEDLGDERALSDYNMIMTMRFDNQADYEIYQKDERHLKGRKDSGKYMAGPPATYDFMSE